MPQIFVRFLLPSLLAFLFWLTPASLQAQSDPVVGQVAAQRGTVTLLRGGLSLMSLPGAQVQQGDRFKTEAESRVRITFMDGSSLSIGASSLAAISNYVAADAVGQQTGVLDLVLGILRFNLLPSSQRAGFEVRTKTAVASVRGTDWIVETVPGKSSVFVVEGLVEVSSASGGERPLLEPGFGVDIPAGKAVGTVKRWGDARVSDVLSRTEVP